ncbi:transmembrane protein, putative (macronuclear) [Tetrahymena thermophila SB210]|uniref:Transmembrane protein, putative n=1 Tax=Tetrahymena thermophila (strain SB210) TaxID=312017 RepID=W7XL24_TETTS|nr:transmembrane protein, putative [Tetrahymena thermophila SB210]EWS75544.1 transmembrane protein, putative [Tetrahymena thermophila SB210]|eukprot:XP_012651910.1 transmembrane protein, putative [Tetrahymena thermophila SB210]
MIYNIRQVYKLYKSFQKQFIINNQNFYINQQSKINQLYQIFLCFIHSITRIIIYSDKLLDLSAAICFVKYFFQLFFAASSPRQFYQFIHQFILNDDAFIENKLLIHKIVF